MKTTQWLLAIFLIIISWACDMPESQSDEVIVSGRILDAATKSGLPDVTIRWKNNETVSRGDGSFQLKISSGFRKLHAVPRDRSPVYKVLKIDDAKETVRQDFLIPKTAPTRKMWVVEKGPKYDKLGNTLPSDFDHHYSLWMTDIFFNNDVPIPTHDIPGNHHCPKWAPDAHRIAFSVETIPANKRLRDAQGIRLFDPQKGTFKKIGPPKGFLNIDWKSDGNALAAATQTEVYILQDVASPPIQSKRIYSLKPDEGVILSVIWTPWNTILFTWDGPLSKQGPSKAARMSKIVSFSPDRADSQWSFFSESLRSVRYPVPTGETGEIIFTSFALDGSDSKIKKTDALNSGEFTILLSGGTKPVHWNDADGELFYLQENKLHLIIMQREMDLILAQTVISVDLNDVP